MIGSTSGLRGLGGGIGIKSTLPGWGKRGAVQSAHSGFSGLGAVDLDRCKRCKDAPPKAWEDPQGVKWCVEHVADCASAAAGAAASAAVDKVGNKIAGKGGGKAAPQRRTEDDLAKGDVKPGDTVQNKSGLIFTVDGTTGTSVGDKAYYGVMIKLPAHYSVSTRVQKFVRSNGTIFYTTVHKLSNAGTPGGETTDKVVLAPYASWNGFVRVPANTKILIKIGDKWEPVLKPFGGDPAGTLIRAQNQWATGLGEGSKEENAFIAAEKAESAAASASAKAGKSRGDIWTDAALATALSLIQSFNAKSFSDIPAGLQKMTDEATFKAALGGKRPGTPYSPDSAESAIVRTRATGTLKWGTILGVAAVAVVAVVGAVFMLRKRRTATA